MRASSLMNFGSFFLAASRAALTLGSLRRAAGSCGKAGATVKAHRKAIENCEARIVHQYCEFRDYAKDLASSQAATALARAAHECSSRSAVWAVWRALPPTAAWPPPGRR